MKLNTVVFSSFLALSLIACGSGDDNAKPDDGKNELPPRPQACIDAGDLCKWDGKEWVVSKPNDDNKPNDEPPAADSTFDYSDIGVTDKLEPEKKGFGFYHKGEKSPLDAKLFKNGVTLSPNIPWSSTLEYDPDLYNFVAIRLGDNKKDEKNPVKFMFDKIGLENQQVNQNIQFFGTGQHNETSGTKMGDPGQSSISSVVKNTKTTYYWNSIPAVVNTFMWRRSDGKLQYVWKDSDNKYFHNQEEESKSNYGSGNKKLRVYGHNAFIRNDETKTGYVVSTEAHFLDPKTWKTGTSTLGTTPLETREHIKNFNHVNFVWYDLSNFTKRKKKARFEDPKESGGKYSVVYHTALDEYKTETADDYKNGDRFPTDVEFGVLESVQFGRLTGQGIDPESEDLSDYKKINLKDYPFTLDKAAAAGNKEAEDWYFARGTKATPVDVLDAYKQAGTKIAYDGQAVMFGLDYRPTQPVKQAEDKNDQSTNAVKPADPKSTFGKILLDGKQNFVRMEWDPSSGEIKGRVYGVWTLATYWRSFDDKGVESAWLFGKYDPSTKLPEEVLSSDTIANMTSKDIANSLLANHKKVPYAFKDIPKANKTVVGMMEVPITTPELAQHIATSAYSLEPYTVTLVSLNGKVNEGTNSFGGVAVRTRDKSKGLFTGGFFGPKGLEVGGVINSQTGSMKDENLTDPSEKWGGAFGAKYNGKSVDEDLIFTDPDVNYNTSTEFFN